ncbi:membrane protein [Mycolicibacter senuensis]|uniref:Membrane protein n=2 Tax=Mycolicibacter senuensis TaxID=386913 RepID=A0A7I9XPT2_9MYCO|nr:membrane protein [Mycolicibacter senuensis]
MLLDRSHADSLTQTATVIPVSSSETGSAREVTAPLRWVILCCMAPHPNRPAQITMVDPANPPSRRAPLVWALVGAVPWLMLAVLQLGWAVADERLAWLHAAVLAVTVLGLLVSAVIAPLWRYRVHRWDISDQAVYTRTGWLVQERRIAPISRIQTVDTYRGPLDRLLGLANVRVTTASSAGAVHIVALDAPVADRVVAQLTDIAALGAGDAT